MEPLKPKKSDKYSKPDPEFDLKSNEKPFMKFYALAFELVVVNAIMIIGGYYLDRSLSSSPAMILIGTLLAVTTTIWLLLRATQ